MATLPAVAEPAVTRAPGAAAGGPAGRGRFRWVSLALFTAPAAVILGALVGYPTVATVIRSFYDRTGNRFVGLDNYHTLFTTTDTLVAIRNNAIWVIVFPILVSFLGLVFAVLTERVAWGTAFKAVVFMPMAISLFATGIIWRIVYETDPHLGVVNSLIGTVADAVKQPGVYALPNIKAASGLQPAADGSMTSTGTVRPGGTLELGLTGIPLSALPGDAGDAHAPSGSSGAVSGVVWRDFSPNGTVGVVDPGEKGMPDVHLDLVRSDGSTAGTTTSGSDGSFRFTDVSSGTYRVAVDNSNFRAPFGGVEWLGTKSLTPTGSMSGTARALLTIPLVDLAEIVAMLWMWCGFAMVVIGAGLAALNREVLEAARMDGATEWQTFRHVTFPLLMPVLIVVFITMIINVLKIFDIVVAMTPESSQQEANVIALEFWRVAFSGNDYGLGSAIAVFLFALVVPVMVMNVRRIRG